MFARFSLSLAACVVAAAIVAGPAGAQTTEVPAPGAVPGACTDTTPPSSSFKAHTKRRGKALRGTASDTGCGVDRVRISLAKKHAGRCRNVTDKGRLAKATKCSKHRWLAVNGTANWSFRLRKRLPSGTYKVRTRAVDFSGNVQHLKVKNLKVR